MSQLDMFGPPPITAVFGLPIVLRQLPDDLAEHGRDNFDRLWALHPDRFFDLVRPGGGTVPVPRWQQAYERAYIYPGSERSSLPTPYVMQPFLRWLKREIDPRLNALAVNWYDASFGHYIGAHQDRVGQLVEGSVIVGISLGDTRTLRFLKKGEKSVDVAASHGLVVVMSLETNAGVYHSIPKPRQGETGRRIAITARCFK